MFRAVALTLRARPRLFGTDHFVDGAATLLGKEGNMPARNSFTPFQPLGNYIRRPAPYFCDSAMGRPLSNSRLIFLHSMANGLQNPLAWRGPSARKSFIQRPCRIEGQAHLLNFFHVMCRFRPLMWSDLYMKKVFLLLALIFFVAAAAYGQNTVEAYNISIL